MTVGIKRTVGMLQVHLHAGIGQFCSVIAAMLLITMTASRATTVKITGVADDFSPMPVFEAEPSIIPTIATTTVDPFPSIAGYSLPRIGYGLEGTNVIFRMHTNSAHVCAQRCDNATGHACIAFTLRITPPATCTGSSWSSTYTYAAMASSTTNITKTVATADGHDSNSASFDTTAKAFPAAEGGAATIAKNNTNAVVVAYYSRHRVTNGTSINASISYSLAVPTAGVRLEGDGVFADRFFKNANYLLQFPLDDMLFWFRQRSSSSSSSSSSPSSSKAHPRSSIPGASWGWDNGGPDRPYGLRGSVAGGFLMGAGGMLRFDANAGNGLLWARVKALVQNISALQGADGYAMAFPRNESWFHENPNYVTSWLTHGLLEAGIAGFPLALRILRGHFDWFNAADSLPYFLPPAAQSAPWPIGPRRSKMPQFDHGHEIYLIYQGLIHNTRMALSNVGQQQDVDTARRRYEETWWLEQLAARNVSAIWLRSKYPHNYEITGVEAYMDLFILTGDERYLRAVDGFWEMFRAHWMHVGGTVAIKEWKMYPPGSYYLDTTGEDPKNRLANNCSLIPGVPDNKCPPNRRQQQKKHEQHGHPGQDQEEQEEEEEEEKGEEGAACVGCTHSTGETCGQAFWIKLNQRMHQFRPDKEIYVTEIERTLYNGVLGQMSADGSHIAQFALLHKTKMSPDNNATCCEGQATRIFGSLPEYFFSANVPNQTLYINMFAATNVSLAAQGLGQGWLYMDTEFPNAPNVTLRVGCGGCGGGGCGGGGGGGGGGGSCCSSLLGLKGLAIRIPSWIAAETVHVDVRNASGALLQQFVGRRGTYLHVRRTFQTGDTLSFGLPMALRATRYTGFTTVQGHERVAIEYGPVLLAATGGDWNNVLDTMVVPGVNASTATTAGPEKWLVPKPGYPPLHFGLRNSGGNGGGGDKGKTRSQPSSGNCGGDGCGDSGSSDSGWRWLPYYEVQVGQLFEVYPSFAK